MDRKDKEKETEKNMQSECFVMSGNGIGDVR